MADTVQPKTSNRATGGWLAVSPPDAQFRIGTTGQTEQEAIDRFFEAWRKWTDALNDSARDKAEPTASPDK